MSLASSSRHRAAARLAALLALCALACRSHPPPAAKRLELELPAAWGATSPSEASGGQVADDPWWRSFEQPGLTSAVEAALAANWDLVAARRRLAVAAAEARGVAGAELPTLGLGADAERFQQVFVGLPIPGADVLQNRATALGVSVNLAWELDLWGRLDAETSAAEAEFVATVHDARGALQSVAAQTAKVWLAWAEAREQIAVAERTVASLSRTVELIGARYQAGTSSAFELRLAEADLETAGASMAARRELGARTVRQLEILCARHPEGVADGFAPVESSGELGAELPDAPALPAVGVPASILERRPDLAAAAARIRALDQRLYAARAALYPTLRLSALAGRVSTDASDLVDPEFDVWSIAAGLVQPLFQGGRLRAGVDAAEARVGQAFATFAGAILAAFGEVETLLAVEEHLVANEARARAASERASAALELARDRYAAGLVDLPTVLETERRTFDTESARLSSKRRRLEARIDLHLALGGGFGEAAAVAAADATLDAESDADPEAAPFEREVEP